MAGVGDEAPPQPRVVLLERLQRRAGDAHPGRLGAQRVEFDTIRLGEILGERQVQLDGLRRELQAASGRLTLPPRGDLPVLISITLLHMVGFNLLASWGLGLVPTGRTVVLAYTTPLWITPGAAATVEVENGKTLAVVGLASTGAYYAVFTVLLVATAAHDLAAVEAALRPAGMRRFGAARRRVCQWRRNNP